MIYAMSDVHGCLPQFRQALRRVDLSRGNQLVLLGDYIHGPDSRGVLDEIMALEKRYGRSRVIALRGNHEEAVLTGQMDLEGFIKGGGFKKEEEGYIRWMKTLRRYYKKGRYIFVHAGVNEGLGRAWKWTSPSIFTEKYPPQLGRFSGGLTIVAGHTGTGSIAGDEDFHDIYFDGESHYYIDGSVLLWGEIPVLAVDTEKNIGYRVEKNGLVRILPYKKEKPKG